MVYIAISFVSQLMIRLLIYTLIFYSDFVAKFQRQPERSAYYFSTSGNDSNSGSANSPLQSLALISRLNIRPGDSLLLKGGDIFNDSIILTKNGTAGRPILISSYGNGSAVINADNESAITVFNSSFIDIKNITCRGSGRKNGNIKSGILISDCNNVNLENVDVSGFQKSGLQLYNCISTNIDNVIAHDNGAAGIGVEGNYANKLGSKNIRITNCQAINNPGDPSNLNNHSGNGIVAGHCTNLLIDHCKATNNGWDMPRIGNGPVGIWAYEADSITIQHCLSYCNKTSSGAADGGGFDLDGGVTHSVVEYCLSYNNQGSGYCIFQYWGASPWHDNVFRFNISIDDGLVSDSRAGTYVWNSSGDSTQFYNCDFYNNTIYDSKQAALAFSEMSKRKNFRFMNNIFIGADSLIRGDKGADMLVANDWYSLQKGFNADAMNDFKKWIYRYKIETLYGKKVGLNVFPPFKRAGNTTFTDVTHLSKFDSYKIAGTSPVTKSGIDLQALFNINIGDADFNGEPVNKRYLGACTHK